MQVNWGIGIISLTNVEGTYKRAYLGLFRETNELTSEMTYPALCTDKKAVTQPNNDQLINVLTYPNTCSYQKLENIQK